MNIVIAPGHATTRMQQRGITPADIEHALSNCVQHSPGEQGGTCHLGFGLNGQPLKVWTLHTPLDHAGTVIVKSAAWKGTS